MMSHSGSASPSTDSNLLVNSNDFNRNSQRNNKNFIRIRQPAIMPTTPVRHAA